MKVKKPVEVHLKHKGDAQDFWQSLGEHDSTQAAEKWLKENAENGQTYGIITIHREVTASIASVKKVTLA